MRAVEPRPFVWETRSAAATAASRAQAGLMPRPSCSAGTGSGSGVSAPPVVDLALAVHHLRMHPWRAAVPEPYSTFTVSLVRGASGTGAPGLPAGALAQALRRQGAVWHAVVATEIEAVAFPTRGTLAAAPDTAAGLRAAAADEFGPTPSLTLVRLTLGGGDGHGALALAWRALPLRCRVVDTEQPILLWHNERPVPWGVETLRVPRGWCVQLRVTVVDTARLRPCLATVFTALAHVAVIGGRRDGTFEAPPVPLDADGSEQPDTPVFGDAGAIVLYDGDGARLTRPSCGERVAVHPPWGQAASIAADTAEARALACDVAAVLWECSPLAP